jgi:protein O-GlcNAc transferase
LPVLTLLGESFAGRVAASILTALGMPELITATSTEFEDRAVALANDRPAHARIRQKLIENQRTAPLFDAARYARHLETAYTQMSARFEQGLAPGHISLG